MLRGLWKCFGIALFVGASFAFASEREKVTVEDAFWAYDDGKIGYEELEGLLKWIDAGDVSEACAEWEALGLDPCQKKFQEVLTGWNPRGRIGYAISLDSTGSARNKRLYGRLGFGILHAEVRLRSQAGSDWALEYGRFEIQGKHVAFLAGNLVALDFGSAIPLQKRRGVDFTAQWKSFQWGTFALEDSSFGMHTMVSIRKNVQILGMYSASVDGFRDAFARIRGQNSDVQILYSQNWKTPLLYLYANSPPSTALLGRYPLAFRFRAYIHKNDSLPGIFRLSKLVQKNRVNASSWVQARFWNWTFRVNERVYIPLDSGKASFAVDFSFVRNRNFASVGGGAFLNAVGDSRSAQVYVRSGLRLFSAESLFTEVRATPQETFSRTLYEIRPGIRLEWEKNVSSDIVLILRYPKKSPIVLREETRMQFFSNAEGKSSLELRADRLRRLHFWRFGFEWEVKW